MKRLQPGFAKARSSAHAAEFQLALSPTHCVYVSLCVKPYEDMFTVEVGWGLVGGPPVGWFELAALLDHPGMVRLGRLFSVDESDVWWAIDPVAPRSLANLLQPPAPLDLCLLRVPVLVREVFECLVGYAVPVWDEVVRRQALGPVVWGLGGFGGR